MSRTPLCGEFVCRQPRRSGVRHLVEGTQQRPDLPLGVVALVARDLGAASSVPVREHALDEVVEHVIERVGRRVACGILAALSAGNRDLTFIGDSLPAGVDSFLPACASSRSSVSQPPSPDADPGRTSASTSQGRGVSATCPMTAIRGPSRRDAPRGQPFLLETWLQEPEIACQLVPKRPMDIGEGGLAPSIWRMSVEAGTARRPSGHPSAGDEHGSDT